MLDKDYVYSLTHESGAFGKSYNQAIESRILVDEFLGFVKNHDPELLGIVRAIQTTETYIEAQQVLGLSKRPFMRARRRLAVLYSSFDHGTSPPRQRKVYRSRSPFDRGENTDSRPANPD